MLDKNAIFRFWGVRSGFNPDSYRNEKSWYGARSKWLFDAMDGENFFYQPKLADTLFQPCG